MYISKLKIKNFKCFDEVEINFDQNFNLIIGENNSGKSTIFDALRLWQLAFQKFLKDRTNNQQSSFYASQFYSFTIERQKQMPLKQLARVNRWLGGSD